jgi:HlyD family secretion protein
MSDRLSRDLASLRIDPSAAAPRGRARPWVPGLLLVLGAAAYVLVRPYVDSALAETEPDPAPVVTPPSAGLAVEPGEVQIVATGYVVPRVTSKVGAKVEGRIDEVFVREGDVVKKSDPLFALDSTTQGSLLAAARARLAGARARAERQRVDLAEAKRRLEREQRLLDQGATTRAEVEDLRGQVQLSRQTWNVARAEIAEAEAELERLVAEAELRTIRAPIDGTVVSDPADVGEAVAPLLPPLVDIADFSSLVVEVDVPEARLAKVELEGPCTIVLDAYPDRELQGAVAEIGPVINRAKATAVTRIRFVGPSEGVLPNMAARVSFLAPPRDARAQAKLVPP